MTASGVVGHHVARFAHRLFVGIGRRNFDFARTLKTVPHRNAAGLEAEHFHVDDVFAVESHQVLHGTHELNGRHTVGQLIVHDLRNRKSLHCVFQSLLQSILNGDAVTNARVDELFVLAVVYTLEFRHVGRNAERGHLLGERSCGFAFGIKTHAHRHEALFEFLIRALFEHFGDQNAHAARSAVSLNGTCLGKHGLSGQRLLNAGGKSFGELLQRFRRELFGLQFNK